LIAKVAIGRDEHVESGSLCGIEKFAIAIRIPATRTDLFDDMILQGRELVEYRFLVLEHSLEIYGGIVALIFSALGIWLGLKLTRTREVVVVREVPVEVQVPVPVSGPFQRNEARREQLGITPRELQILDAMAAGLSNREIAERLFVSESTVKTHAARVFGKLAARRRTQAIQLAKEAGLIP